MMCFNKQIKINKNNLNKRKKLENWTIDNNLIFLNLYDNKYFNYLEILDNLKNY